MDPAVVGCFCFAVLRGDSVEGLFSGIFGVAAIEEVVDGGFLDAVSVVEVAEIDNCGFEAFAGPLCVGGEGFDVVEGGEEEDDIFAAELGRS